MSLEKVKKALQFVQHRDARWHDDNVVTPALAELNTYIQRLESEKLVEEVAKSLLQGAIKKKRNVEPGVIEIGYDNVTLDSPGVEKEEFIELAQAIISIIKE